MSGLPGLTSEAGRQARWYRGLPARERARRPRGIWRQPVRALPEETRQMATYPRAGASDVPAQPDFPELETRTLGYWNSHGTFRKSIEERDGRGEFVFYDGPPFANG